MGVRVCTAPGATRTRGRPSHNVCHIGRSCPIWPPECQQAFEAVKYALTHAPVLAMPDPAKRSEVVADARGDQYSGALGAVLLQDGHPIAYESKKLTPAEVHYTTTEQEMLAIIHALKIWRCYLESEQSFTVVTDHCPNTFFAQLPELNRRQARWSEFLQMFKFDWGILTRQGKCG